MKSTNQVSELSLDEQSDKIFKRRRMKDTWARYGIATGGLMVIVAVLLIFFYLLAIVLPLFSSPEMEEFDKSFMIEQAEDVVYHGMGEYGETAYFLHRDGTYSTYRIADDISVKEITRQPLIAATEIVGVESVSLVDESIAALDAEGNVHVFKLKARLDYSTGKRVVYPEVEKPFGDAPIQFDVTAPLGRNPAFSISYNESGLVAALNVGGQLTVKRYTLEESMLEDSASLELDAELTMTMNESVFELFLNEHGDRIYAVDRNGKVALLQVTSHEVKETNHVQLDKGTKLTAATMLLGRFSVLVGDSKGTIHQLFPARDENNNLLIQPVRYFKFNDKPIIEIIPEARRKGFLVLDEDRSIGVFYTTSARKLLSFHDTDAKTLAINTRQNRILAQNTDGNFSVFRIENEHPEVSFSSLWQRVWYEGYSSPDFIWQSSASTNDFEPKFSLTPLTFGTLKAAFYAMLFSVPLAICGAIYTAYFMRPSMRRFVKPSVEIMEALPTVILGFLAGLWLAPFVEDNLAGIFSMLIILPIAIMLFGLAWHFMPMQYKNWVMSGWHAALLIPLIMVVAVLSIQLGNGIESTFFDGSVRQWITADLGVTFDQRNSLVVGLAMGFAVIPTIFSITEDALFSVPKHLSNGSLALGASPWQTVTRVVLPTASPGMFSAIMIGFGRAVGETMIVLMATGNTAVMEMNIFEGMRTLSANIAVEMPESEVASTHFRVLFLAAFVLFLFTFVFNTGAEVIRQRLRKKYGSL